MTRDNEPNASYYSTRYAERKRAAERARDARAPAQSCNRCENIRAPGSIFCTAHADEYATIVASGATADELLGFLQTHLLATGDHVSTELPDRDTLDAVVLYDLALTLIAKADMYPDRTERVIVWLREMPRLDERDRRIVNACADLLALIRQD